MSDETDAGSALGTPKPGEGGSIDFIRTIIDEDLASGRHSGRVATLTRSSTPGPGTYNSAPPSGVQIG